MRLLGLNLCLRMSWAAALPALWVCLPNEARAEDLQIDPRPNIDVSVAPPPAPVQRTYQVHEGFYLRANLGIGTLSSDLSGTGVVDLSSSGAELDADLLIGAGLAPGITLGGGLIYGTQISGDWELDNGISGASGDLSTAIIGPFIDGFPSAKDGWHFGGLAGLAYASFDPGPGADSSTALGFGGSFWAGQDFWVAPEWSVGGLLRIAALRATDDDITATKLSFSLMFTALLN